MDTAKRKALEAAGWKFGDAEDFLRGMEQPMAKSTRKARYNPETMKAIEEADAGKGLIRYPSVETIFRDLDPKMAKTKPESNPEVEQLLSTLVIAATALHVASQDIREWRQLARYQREKMDQNLGWCPTQAALDSSEKALSMIASAFKAIREVASTDD